MSVTTYGEWQMRPFEDFDEPGLGAARQANGSGMRLSPGKYRLPHAVMEQRAVSPLTLRRFPFDGLLACVQSPRAWRVGKQQELVP